MNPDHQYDIVIVGGGMAGLSQALALTATGLNIALIDQQRQPGSVEDFAVQMKLPEFSDRVSALTPASRKLLEELKVWDQLAGLRVSPYRDMAVWDADGSGSIHFSADELHLDCLGYIVENQLLNCVLAQAAAQKPNLRMKFQVQANVIEQNEQGWQITLNNGEMLTCSLLIGADGGNSRIRELAGFDRREWSYEQKALVCTVKTSKPHGHTAWQRFMQSGPLAYLPLHLPGAVEQHYSSIVWSCNEALAAELLNLSATEFATRLEQGLESKLGKVELISAPQAFPLQQRHATDYVKAGVALIGDAAHTIHPLAGQGINLGLADVASLSGVIKQAVTRGQNYASLQVLSRYQRDRKPANLAMMLGMEGFKRAFGSDDLIMRLLRNQGLNLADQFIPLKHELMKRAMGL